MKHHGTDRHRDIPRRNQASAPTLVLKSGREKSLLRRHPWIFSGGIDFLTGNPTPGASVEVQSAQREFLGWAAFSPASQIAARVWSFDRDQPLGPELIRRRLEQALARRRRIDPQPAAAGERLVHAESDGLPGLIVDRFADHLVVQMNSAGADAWRDCIAQTLIELTGIENLHERSDSDAMEEEGLPARSGTLRGAPLTGPLAFQESDLTFLADIREGHKTGFYLDQRVNRAALRAYVRDRDVLDCFCYTGGFTTYALAGGARSVIAVDASQPALDLAREHIALNDLESTRASFVAEDVFALLRRYRDAAKSFDVIILDPPKFAPRATLAERAARGYKDINLLAFKLLRPGGLLFTFSCSGGIDPGLFQKIVAGAALDAGVDAHIMQRLGASPDHPVALEFPEGEYLKGLLCMRS